MSHEIIHETLTENSTGNNVENLVEESPPVSPPRKIGFILLGLMLLAGLGFSTIHPGAAKSDKAGKKDKRKQVASVTVAMVTQKTVPVQLQAIGNVQPASTVSITPQASGRITGVYFKKGQDVKKGQLLFTLDDSTQAAAIQQARGTLAKDQAQIQQAQATLSKDQGQIEQAQATLAKDLGQIEQAKATLAKDQGLVRQAQATLTKDTAQAQYAQAQSKRYGDLYKQGAISQDQAQQYSTNGQASLAILQSDKEAITNAQAVVRGDTVAIQNAQAVVRGDRVAIENARAVVQGDRAAIKNAQAVLSGDEGALKNVQVQSSYTKIYAPTDGRAGNILVTQGNVVQAGGTNPLVTLAKIHPIQVAFSVPESNLPEVQKYMQNGKLKVDVAFSKDKTKTIPGFLTFVNNTVDNTTGTIQLIGDFENIQGQLFPGEFVNTTLTLTQQPNATVVPAQAVQNGPNGQFVFVVKNDTTVENVPVTVSSTIDGLDVISKGLQPGDKVVTDGQANLVTGSKIKIQNSKYPAGRPPVYKIQNDDSVFK